MQITKYNRMKNNFMDNDCSKKISLYIWINQQLYM